MPEFPVVAGKQMIRFLDRRGFMLARIRDSHHRLKRGETLTTVPMHGNEPPKPKRFAPF